MEANRNAVELRCVESQSIGMAQKRKGYEMTRAGEAPFGPASEQQRIVPGKQ